jgi:hypothetical protein
MAMASEAAIEKLLAEALDDFDADPPPAAQAGSELGSAAAAPVPPPPGPVLPSPAPAHGGDPTVQDKAPAHPAASSEADPTDELANMLMKTLAMESDHQEMHSDGASPGPASADDHMEQTLRTLAASAEALADETSSGSAAEEDVLLQNMLKQLQDAASGSGVPGGNMSDTAMMDLLQKLSAEANDLLPGLGGTAPAGSHSSATPATSSAASFNPSGPASTPAHGGSASAPAGAEAEDAEMEGLLDNLVGQVCAPCYPMAAHSSPAVA